MASTYKIVRGSPVEFGASNEKLPTTFGYIISASCDNQAKTVEVPNSDGAIIDLVIYDEISNISLVVMFKVDVPEPEIGSTMSINDLSAIITGIKHDWSASGLRQMTLTATAPKNLVVKKD